MAPLKGLTLVLATLALSLGAAMDALDISIANVCIPEISGDLGVTPFDGAWIISAYALTNAAMILLAGFLALRIGEVRLFTLSVLIFTIASFLCGIAPNFITLVIYRLIQGAAAGPLVPLCQSLLLKSFPAKLRTLGLSISLMLLIIAPIFGPVVGGYITDTIGWRWIFFLNVPLGFICASLSWYTLKDRETPLEKRPVDVVGLILLIAAVGAFQLFLSLGNDHGWLSSNIVIAALITCIITASFFAAWTLASQHPIINFALFKMHNYSVANVLSLFAYVAFYAGFVLYPIWLQIEMGYTALWAGYALIPLGGAILLLTPITGILVEKVRLDLRIILTLSFIAFGLSFFWAGKFNDQASFYALLGPRIVLGVALGLFCIPSYIVALSDMAKADIADAVSVFNFVRVIGIGIGTAVGISTFQTLQQIHYNALFPLVSVKNTQLAVILGKFREGNFPPAAQFAWIHEQLASQSITIAVNDFFTISSVGFILLIVLIWFLRPPFPQLEEEML